MNITYANRRSLKSSILVKSVKESTHTHRKRKKLGRHKCRGIGSITQLTLVNKLTGVRPPLYYQRINRAHTSHILEPRHLFLCRFLTKFVELMKENFPSAHLGPPPRRAGRPLLSAAGPWGGSPHPPLSVGPQGVACAFNWHVPSPSRTYFLRESRPLRVTGRRCSRKGYGDRVVRGGRPGPAGSDGRPGARARPRGPPRRAP